MNANFGMDQPAEDVPPFDVIVDEFRALEADINREMK